MNSNFNNILNKNTLYFNTQIKYNKLNKLNYNNIIKKFISNFIIIIEKITNNLFIFDKKMNLIFTFFYNNVSKINDLDSLIKKTKNNILDNTTVITNFVIINKNMCQKYFTLFFYYNSWYVFYINNNIYNIYNIYNIQTHTLINVNNETIIFNKFINKYSSYEQMDTDVIYYFLVEHNNFFTYGILEQQIENIYLLYTYNKYGIKLDDAYNYFKSINNIETTLETNLIYCGFTLQIYNKTLNNYEYFEWNNDVYEYILSVFPKYTNIYVNYLLLYQQNILKQVIQYTHSYANNILNIIISSFKTLSKEILNIYFATRHKKNTSFYHCLTSQYKKTLYELHNIYFSNKFKNNQNNFTISLNTIYTYLKNVNVFELKKLFVDRQIILNNIKKFNNQYVSYFYYDRYEIIILSELLNK
jgi:hypothetical protein